MTTYTISAGNIVMKQAQMNKELNDFLNAAKQRQLKVESCEIPSRMKELLRPTVLNADLNEVTKFIWDSLTPDEQFTCLMTFPEEIEQLIGKEE
ncbi:hypothetical protein G8O18_14115 [Enterobacter kobei]|uniref:hypothetical protein n=1 Tax=Enterobacter kobei TaxID=208224 RepID=UPI002F2DD8AB